MANNEHNFPVLDASHPDTTILDEDGMTEQHVAEADDWATLPVHPAADMLPMMSDAELEDLAADIKANGLLEPIVVWEDNTEAAKGGEGPFPTYLLDGRNRLAALKLLGITDPRDAPKGKGANYGSGWAVKTHSALVSDQPTCGASKPTKWLPDVNPVTYVLSRNVHRRHLTSEQKRQAIAAFIKADPTTSDRTVAKELGVDNKTAAKVRADLEAREEIPHVSTRTDSAGRKQPATKRKPTPEAQGDSEARADRRGHDRRAADHNRATRWADRELTGPDRPRQAGTGKRQGRQGRHRTGADDSAIGPPPDDSDTGPDFGIALCGIAAALDKLAVYVTALDTDARLKVVEDHIDAINDVAKKMQRMIKALKAAQKTRAQDRDSRLGGAYLPRENSVVALRRVQSRQRPIPRAPGQPVRSNDWSVASQRPRCELHLASKVRERSERHRQQVAASVVCRSSDSVAPKGNPMQHKSVPLLIKGADDDSGTFTGLASVFDNSTTTVTLFVEMPSASHSVAAHTLPLVWMHKADDPCCSVGEVVEAAETYDGLAIKGRFDRDSEFG